MLTTRRGVDVADTTLSRAGRPTMRPDVGETAADTGMLAAPAIRDVLLRVDGEYREMPGLSLTLSQAARFWGLDLNTCRLVLAQLIERGVLRQAWNGAYVRRDM